MLFSDSVKTHYLSRIDELGDRFNPDMGQRTNGLEGSPIQMLMDWYPEGDDGTPWEKVEKEFQLPRWLIGIVWGYAHDYNYDCTCKELFYKFFEAIPTYADIDKLFHTFTSEFLIYITKEAGSFYVTTWNRTKRELPIFCAEVLSNSIAQHQLCARMPKQKFNYKVAFSKANDTASDLIVGLNRHEHALFDNLDHLNKGFEVHGSLVAFLEHFTDKDKSHHMKVVYDLAIKVCSEYK